MPFALRDDHDGAVVRDSETGAEIGVTPAQADHVVISGPVQECVVGSVVDDEASSASDIRLHLLLDALGPLDSVVRVATVEIIDDNLVPGEVRIPLIECLRSDGGDVDAEAAGLVENRADASGCSGPIVVVDAIDDQNADLRMGEGGHPDQATGKGDRA
jgi:hypothetical protein